MPVLRFTTALVALVAAGCAVSPDANPVTETSAPSALQAVSEGKPQRLIVLLDEAPAIEARRASPGLSAVEATAAATAALERVKDDLLAGTSSADLSVLHRYPALPAMHVEVRSLAALSHLLSSQGVLRVVEDEPHEAFLAQSLPLIHQPVAAANGALGQGTAVAVLDTGVDYTRTDFGSCSAPGVPGCKVAYAQDFAPSDGQLDDNGHGTNVAAIVAGVAPSTSILALDVFNGAYAYSSDILSAISWCVTNRAVYNIVAMNMSLGAGGSTSPCGSDVFAGSIHTARLAGILTAAASGNNGYSNMISSPACAPDAVSVGAVYDSAMGGIAYSSCTDASTAADQVTCFSNSASFLTLLAPGALITAGGHTMAGTSQATPHVAGSIAVYKSAVTSATPDQVVAFLTASGVRVTDPRNGVITPRVDLAQVPAPGCILTLSPTSLSVGGAGGSTTLSVSTGSGCAWSASTAATWLSLSPSSGTGPGTITLTAPVNIGVARNATVSVGGHPVTVSQAKDQVPPVGSVAIVGGTITRTLAVALHITGSDAAGVSAMCLSNTTSCTAWRTFASDLSWSLASGTAGARSVYVRLKDGAGNVGGPFVASAVYDATPPTGGTLAAVAGVGSASLSWGGFSDPVTGVASYQLVYATGAAPANCSVGTVLYSGTGTSFVKSGLSSGVIYYFRVCATDGAGNMSAGRTASARAR
ncbi:MAG TPA: S8 family serine peptidase [Anaeromyxobacter sp.]|nr:S8 family serine peptidase [Anaeromyxobacter sp.]